MKNLNKMKIAGDMQFEIGQDKVSHFPDLSVKDDVTLHKKLDDMKHSTFDLSKFTVVGSPNITNDGIASGFSNENYIRNINAITKPYTFEVDMVVDYPTDSWCEYSSTILCDIYKDSSNYIRLKIIKSNQTINIDTNINGVVIAYSSNSNVVSLGAKNVRLQWGYNGTNYYIKQNGITLVDKAGAWISEDIAYDLCIGRDLFVSNWQFLGSIDLSHFSITVDGKEVFSGNKTGIDTIKPDDYTVVGNPTITDDGIAKYIGTASGRITSTAIDFSTSSSWEIVFPYYTGNTNSTAIQVIMGAETGSVLQLVRFQNTDICQMQCPETSFGVGSSLSNFSLNLNTQYICKVGQFITNGVITTYFKYKADTDNNYTVLSNTNATKIFDHTGAIAIGGYNGTNMMAYGSIDLNSFKIYVDGNLVYQPCLKIPYTQSKTGSKIVDSVYRDRVIDLYEQVGYSHYFTLGKNDFTLATCKGSDVVAQGEADGIAYTKTADLTLTQRGNCTSGSVVNLLPYKDENSYHVSTPYTAKTSNSFISSVDGDFIAVGKCYL